MQELDQLQTITNIDMGSIIRSILLWVIVPTVILTIVVIIGFLVAMIRRWKMERAIFEIRDILRDMQAMQKAAASMQTANEDTQTTASEQSAYRTPIS